MEGGRVSATTTKKRGPRVTDRPAPARNWERTSQGAELIASHLKLVRKMYAGADDALMERLLSREVWGNTEAMRGYGLVEGSNRVSQWYSATERLQLRDQFPHPGAAPIPDSAAGHRGPHAIQGSIEGRWILHGLQSGKLHWDPWNRQIIRNEFANNGGAPRKS
jgi:hypothetical protein